MWCFKQSWLGGRASDRHASRNKLYLAALTPASSFYPYWVHTNFSTSGRMSSWTSQPLSRVLYVQQKASDSSINPKSFVFPFPLKALMLWHHVKMCSPRIAQHFSCPSFIPSILILIILLLLPDPVMKSRRKLWKSWDFVNDSTITSASGVLIVTLLKALAAWCAWWRSRVSTTYWSENRSGTSITATTASLNTIEWHTSPCDTTNKMFPVFQDRT